MCEQIGLVEKDTQLSLCELIISIIEVHDDLKRFFRIETSKDGASYSILFDSALICRTTSNKKGVFIVLREIARPYVLADFEIVKNKSEQDFFRVKIDNQHAVYRLSNAINVCFDFAKKSVSGDSFDCCSLYEKCSDSRKCLRLGELRSLSCTYRKKLEKNIIFFGVNRNVN